MEKSVTKKQKVIVVRGGIYIYFDADNEDKVLQVINQKKGQIIEIEGQLVNTVAIEGIYDPAFVEEVMMRRRGMWKCIEKGHWNDRSAKRCSGCYINP